MNINTSKSKIDPSSMPIQCNLVYKLLNVKGKVVSNSVLVSLLGWSSPQYLGSQLHRRFCHQTSGRLPLLSASLSYLPTCSASQAFGLYQIIHPGHKGMSVNQSPNIIKRVHYMTSRAQS